MAQDHTRVGGTRQAGVFLLLFAIVAVVLIGMLALLIGSGFLASNRTLLQNTSNNVAMAAVEGFSSARTSNFALRACVGRTRAERVLEANEIKGFDLVGVALPPAQADLTQLGEAEAGTLASWIEENRCEVPVMSDAVPSARLVFGQWIEDRQGDPAAVPNNQTIGTTACCPSGGACSYPCFVDLGADGNLSAADTQAISAVRVDVETPTENPFFIPFVGQSPKVSARSYAVVVPRCFAGVVDLSYSSVVETHPLPVGDDIYPAVVAPPATFCRSCQTTVLDPVYTSCGEALCGGDPACTGNCKCSAELAVSADPPPGVDEEEWPEIRDARLQRPWIPWRGQEFYPRFNPALEPPYLGLPAIPLEALIARGADGTTPPILFDEDNCALTMEPSKADQYFTPFIWCNMWRGRDPADRWQPYGPEEFDGSPNTSITQCGAGIPQLMRLNKDTTPLDTKAHFWSDYDPLEYLDEDKSSVRSWFPRPHQSPYGPLLVDRLIPKPLLTAPDPDNLGQRIITSIASTGPEPLSRYMSAMNAAFRLVAEQSAAGDRALVLGFAGDLMFRNDQPDLAKQVAVIPGPGMDNANGATADFSLLAQVTNPLGRGAYYWDQSTGKYSQQDPYAAGTLNALREYHPNLIDVGFVSRLAFDTIESPSRIGYTNILKALLAARARLQNPANGAGCGPGSLRSLVLFTDGINTCAPITDNATNRDPAVIPSENTLPNFVVDSSWPVKLLTGSVTGAPDKYNPDWFRCDNGIGASATRYADYYQRYEDFLFGGPSFAGLQSTDDTPRGLVDLLRRDRIAVTSVVDGNALGAYWSGVRRPEGEEGEPYLTLAEIRATPQGVRFDGRSFVRATGVPLANDADGYAQSGSTALFGRPLETLGRLAFETGGTLWPILPRCTPANCAGCGGASCYSDPTKAGSEVKSCAWENNNRLRCSPLNYSESEQAAYVMIESIGQKPFSLRQPVAGDIN